MSYASRFRGAYDLTFTKVVTGNTSYTTAHVICFQGTGTVGVPYKITFIGGYIDAGAIQSIRIYDLTNNNVIAEATNINVPFPSVVDLGVISNLPEGHAVWEIQQCKAGTGPKEVAIASGCEYY